MPTAEAHIIWESDTTEELYQEWAEYSQEEILATEQCVYHISEELDKEIDRAREILELTDDWDGEGSPAYSQSTFDLAVAFLTSHSKYLWEHSCLHPPVPHIAPGPNGSIDLHWKRATWELLVNIPANTNEMAVFYGDNYGAQKIKGSIDPRQVNFGIATWLMH
jgi:hypothetical protein